VAELLNYRNVPLVKQRHYQQISGFSGNQLPLNLIGYRQPELSFSIDVFQFYHSLRPNPAKHPA